MNPPVNKQDSDKSHFGSVIVKQAPYGIIVCRDSGDIILSNDLAAFLLQEKSLDGKNLLQLMDPFPPFKKGWKALLTEAKTNFTLPFSINKDKNDINTSYSANLSMQATRLNDFEIPGSNILIFIEDLSSDEALEAADKIYTDSLENLVDEKNVKLESIQKLLIESEKRAAMIETAGAVAHELRQPLTTIIGIIEILSTNSELKNSPKLEKRFATIQKQCLRMAETITNMESMVRYKTKPYIKGSLILDIEESSNTERDN